MNAGRNHDKARAWALANANSDGKPRWLHEHGGVWWIDKDEGDPGNALGSPPRERVDPDAVPAGVALVNLVAELRGIRYPAGDGGTALVAFAGSIKATTWNMAVDATRRVAV